MPYPIMDSMLSPQMPRKNGRSRPPASGFRRITFDVPTEDAARFKAVCALNQTSMAAEIQILIAAEIAEPERLLSQRLHLAGAPRPLNNGQYALRPAIFPEKAG